MLVSRERLLWCPCDDKPAVIDTWVHYLTSRQVEGVEMSQLQGMLVAAAMAGAVTCVERQPMKQ
jgi:hypothetical protein